MIGKIFIAGSLAASTAACAETYPGGVIETDSCVESVQTYDMQVGDELAVGVGDISANYSVTDYLRVQRLGSTLMISSVGHDGTSFSTNNNSSGDIRVETLPTENGVDLTVLFGEEEDGIFTAVLSEGDSDMRFSASLQNEIIVVSLERDC